MMQRSLRCNRTEPLAIDASRRTARVCAKPCACPTRKEFRRSASAATTFTSTTLLPYTQASKAVYVAARPLPLQHCNPAIPRTHTNAH
jgi:hypothetical protein